MAHIRYHNNIVNITEIVYESHMDLIKSICIELEQPDKISSLQEKFLEKLKLKARRDPDRPKKPKTSYMFFCEENREVILKDRPNIILGEQSKLLGSAWKICKDKDLYIKKADVDKSRYSEQMEDYEVNSY